MSLSSATIFMTHWDGALEATSVRYPEESRSANENASLKPVVKLKYRENSN